MPTPSIYRTVARRLVAKKATLWIFALLGFLMILLPLVFVILWREQTLPNIPMGIGVIILMSSWGLFLVGSWFSDQPTGFVSKKVQNIFPQLHASAKVLLEWYGSIFLTLWFCAGLAMGFFLLIKF